MIAFVRHLKARRILTYGLLLGVGFVGGRIYGTIDVYQDSRTGDFIDVPNLISQGIFDLGTVFVQYPAGWSITAYRGSSDYPNQLAYLIADWGGARIHLSCTHTKPETTRVSLVSDYNLPTSSLTLRQGKRQTSFAVNLKDKVFDLDADASNAFITFLAETPFPRHVTVLSQEDVEKATGGRYDIPTMGVQNVSATVSANGSPGKSLAEPPSDPFRVMQRWCSEPARKP